MRDPDEGQLTPRLESWDCATRIRLSRDIDLDLHGLLGASHLSSAVELSFVVTAESTSTRIRRLVFSEPASEGSQALSLDLSPTELGGTLVLITRLVLTRSARSDELAASRPGSVMWEHVVRIDLEGNAARFPIELVSFKEAGLPEHAPWRIDIWDSDLEAPAGSATRVRVNSDHQQAREMALDPSGSASSKLIVSALEADVAGRMLQVLIDNGDIADDSSFVAGSIGEALATFQRVHLPGESLKGLRASRGSELARVEAELLGSLEAYS